MSVTIANLESVVAERPAISLDELNNVAALLTRIDRKYVLDSETATAFLAKLPLGTLALEIDGLRQFGYTSTYLDTDELDSFRATAHKRARRGKVRTRRYLDSGLSFLEVKTRRRGATVKTRVPYSGETLDAQATAFVTTTLATDGVRFTSPLRPVMEARYRRSTLLLPDGGSRLTIDTDLEWRLDGSTGQQRLEGVVIVETKSASHACAADRLLWRSHHRPTAISKFATGMAALRPDLPRNRWHRLLTSDLFAARHGH